MNDHDIILMGSSISSYFAAIYLKQEHPNLKITVVGPSVFKLPIVGESLTEFSTQMLHRIGLNVYLEEEHYHKYGLSFYYKENLDDPSCRRYSVHEAPSTPPLPGRQINRFTLDKKLRELAVERGIGYIDGKVLDLELGKPHSVIIKTNDGTEIQVNCKWLIDATGRKQIIGTKLNLKQEVPFQRSSFWFRLADFDRNQFTNIEAVRDKQIAFDPYYATHHFIGKQKWVWCIPLKDPQYKDLISIGVVWRPDLISEPIKDINQFLEVMDLENPVLSDLVKSGTVVDTNFYNNYLYLNREIYSTDRWFLLGDAAASVDPLYSTGIVITSLQMTQISEMIRRDINGTLTEEVVHTFDRALSTFRNGIQYEISTLYEGLSDNYEASWRVHFSSTLYFFFLLPAWLSGYMSDPVGARWIAKILISGGPSKVSLLKLLKTASQRLGKLPSEKIKNIYKTSVNWQLWDDDEKKIPKHLSGMFSRFASYRWELMKAAGVDTWIENAPFLIRELALSALLPVLYLGSTIRRSNFTKKLIKECTCGCCHKEVCSCVLQGPNNMSCSISEVNEHIPEYRTAA